jgi:hypothetical protein
MTMPRPRGYEHATYRLGAGRRGSTGRFPARAPALAVHRCPPCPRSADRDGAAATRSGRRGPAPRRRTRACGARTRPRADLPGAPSRPGGGRRYQARGGASGRSSSSFGALARPFAASPWSDHQFGARAGGLATSRAFGRLRRLLFPGLCHRQPSGSRRSRPLPLDAHGQIRAHAGRGPRRHRRDNRPPSAGGGLRRDRSDWRPGVTALCPMRHSVSEMP